MIYVCRRKTTPKYGLIYWLVGWNANMLQNQPGWNQSRLWAKFCRTNPADKIFAKNDKLFRINSKGITTNFVVKDFNDKVLKLSSENDAVLWHSTTHLNIGREELLNGFWFIQK